VRSATGVVIGERQRAHSANKREQFRPGVMAGSVCTLPLLAGEGAANTWLGAQTSAANVAALVPNRSGSDRCMTESTRSRSRRGRRFVRVLAGEVAR
jgi:hypothetical protein